MKKIISLVLLGLICYTLVSGLFGSDLQLKSVAIEDRDSAAYVTKSVNGSNSDVIFGQSKNLEDGSANIVSSIVVNYRSFDTLGEVTVLFIASLGIAFLLGGSKKRMDFYCLPNFMLRVGTRLIFGFLVLLGVFMMSHGHLTPGGGFPGGSIIATAVLLLYLGDHEYRANLSKFKITESAMGTVYVLIGLAGLLIMGSFLTNFLDTGVVGTLLSGGILPIIYVVIGLKVGSELVGVIDNFIGEEVVS